MTRTRSGSIAVGRLVAVLLLAALSLLPRQLALFAYAEEAAPEEVVALANPAKAVEVSFPSGTNSKRDISVQLAYTDDLFARPAVEYNDKLGYASVCLAVAAGNSNLGGSDYTDKGRNISAFLSDIGCEDVQLNEAYAAKPMTVAPIACAIGHKSITVDEAGGPKTYQLFVIGVRGISYESEWAGNFMVGAGGEHQGFQDARDAVLSFALPYMREHTKAGDAVKVWIAGYSRAGATTNLVGGWLDKWIYERNNGAPYTGAYTDAYREDHSLLASDFNAGMMRNTERQSFPTDYLDPDVSLSERDVYCYPVSAPQGAVASDAEAHRELTTNIHSLLNPEDWITQIAMGWWGFARYGGAQDHDVSGTYADGDLMAHDRIIAVENEGRLVAMLKRLADVNPSAGYDAPWFRQYYLSYFKMQPVYDEKGEGNQYVSQKQELKYNQGGYYDEFMRFFLDGAMVDGRDSYASTIQDDLMHLSQMLMGLSPEKASQLGSTAKECLEGALREELKKPRLNLEKLGLDALAIYKLAADNEEGLSRVVYQTLSKTLDRLDEEYDEGQLQSAADTVATIVSGAIKKETKYFYHLCTMLKNAKSVGQAHFPEVILSWWEEATAASQPELGTKRTVYFYDNADFDTKSANDALVFSADVYEGDRAYISVEDQPVTSAGAPIDTGVSYYDAPKLAGYTLAGWETSDGMVSYDVEDSVMYADFVEGGIGENSGGPADEDALSAASDDIELFALWYDDAVYMVRYHANTGAADEESYEAADYAENDSLRIDANGFANEGRVFAGWNTKPDGTGTAVQEDALVPLSELGLMSTDAYHEALGVDPDAETSERMEEQATIDLYAQWTQTGTDPVDPEPSKQEGDKGDGGATPSVAPSHGPLPKTDDALSGSVSTAAVAGTVALAALLGAFGLASLRRKQQ